jgi:hypothetical protein
VFDADNGRPISSFDLLDYTELRRYLTDPAHDVALQLMALSVQRGKTSDKPAMTLFEHAPCRWMIVADGYQPAWGDETAFEWGTEGASPKRCVVRLRPGWGATVYAFRSDDESGTITPMSGVSVIGDGSELGITDADGLVGVSAMLRPKCLTIERFGYHVVQATGLDGCRLGPNASAFSVLLRAN